MAESEITTARIYPQFDGEIENFEVWYGAMKGLLPKSLCYLSTIAELLQANPYRKLPHISVLQAFTTTEAARKLFRPFEIRSFESTLYNACQNFLSEEELGGAAAASKVRATDGPWTPNPQANKVKSSPPTGGTPEASSWGCAGMSGSMMSLFAAEGDEKVNTWWRMKLPFLNKSSFTDLVTFFSNPGEVNLKNDSKAFIHLRLCYDMKNLKVMRFINATGCSRADFAGADYLHHLYSLLSRYWPLHAATVKDAEERLIRQITAWNNYGGNFLAYQQDVRAKQNELADLHRRAHFAGRLVTWNGSNKYEFAFTLGAA